MTDQTRDVPAPGSEAARRQGCQCPVVDNAWGGGAYLGHDGKPLYYVNERCALHGSTQARL